MSNEIVTYQADPQALSLYMPVVDVRMAVERRNMIEAFVKNVMVDKRDFGTIPGAGDKKVLLKAGAEKFCSFFGLLPDFVPLVAILDFDGTGEGHGEPLIYYRVRCDLYKSGVKVGAGEASCHSRETKYRWRNAARTCPTCGQAAIIKGKEEYGGGWLCFKKNGGCGAKFKDGDKAIESQTIGRIFNPDVPDLDNTILKMADKRALVAATLICGNLSDYFTQDMDDFASVGSTLEYDVETTATITPAPAGNGKPAPAPEYDYKAVSKRIREMGNQLFGDQWPTEAKAIAKRVGFEWAKATPDNLEAVIAILEAQEPQPALEEAA